MTKTKPSFGLWILVWAGVASSGCAPRVEIAVDASDGAAGDDSTGSGTTGGNVAGEGQGGQPAASTSGGGPAGHAGEGAGNGQAGQGPVGCFSPTMNLDTAYEGGVGCPCDPATDLDTCRADSSERLVALTCVEGRWAAVEDGACSPRSYLVCGHPVDPGPCDNVGIEQFYFDVETNQCEPFTYHCDGNDNRFASLEECERQCEVAATPSACSVPPETGPCLAAMARYFFDPATGSCSPFVYGGCGGGANNFHDKLECEAACDPQNDAATVQAARGSGAGCDGFGVQVTGPGDEGSFTRSGNVLSRNESWGCGCATRAEFVMLYEYTAENGPVGLRLCHDDGADPCEAACSGPVSYDLSRAFQAFETTDFVFVE